MNLYLVSKASQEKDREGVILRAYTRVFGVYTIEDRAIAIAEKNQAAVSTMVADEEKTVTVTEWLNPGFANGG